MRYSITCLAGLLAFAGSAGQVIAETPNWTGLYFGVGAGKYWGRNDWEVVAPLPGAPTSFPFDGTLYEGHIGYNFRQGSIVFGPELSVLGGNVTGSMQCPDSSSSNSNCANRLRSMWTLAGRVGVPMGKFLPYASLGYTQLNMRATSELPPADFSSGNGTHRGVAVGGGVDYAISSQIWVGLDVRYYWFESKDYLLTGSTTYLATIKPDPTVITLRMSIKLDEPPPPSASEKQ